ncbi:MAG: NYN domain-containing protein, partial [Actinomycetota bacterium]
MTFRVVIDGSNMLKPQDALPWSLAYLRSAIDAVRLIASAASKSRPLRLHVLVDASTFYKLTPSDQDTLEQMEKRGEIERTPSKSEADPWILKWADANEALVISNDAYAKFKV